MSNSDPVAVAIAERLLETTGYALETGDFPAFSACFLLPKTLVTFEGQRVVKTLAEFRDVFDAVRGSLVMQGAARLERFVEEACFVAKDTIASTHITQVQLRSGDLLSPYPTLSTLRHVAGEWFVGDSQYALDGAMAHALSSSLWDGAQTTDSTMAQIFADLLKRITQAILKNDFSTFKACVKRPALFHSRRGTQLIETEQDLRQDLDLYQTEFDRQNVDEIIRIPRAVHAMGQGRMVGVYATHILSGTSLVVPSFESSMYLDHCSDGAWRVSCVMHARGHQSLTDHAPGRAAGLHPFTVIMKSGPHTSGTKTTGDHHA